MGRRALRATDAGDKKSSGHWRPEPFGSVSVGTDQRQFKPRPDGWRQGVIIAPTQFEAVPSSRNRYGLEPVRPRAFGLGQHKMIDVNLIPVFGETRAVGGGSGCFVLLCLACSFRRFASLSAQLGPRKKHREPQPMPDNRPLARVIPPA